MLGGTAPAGVRFSQRGSMPGLQSLCTVSLRCMAMLAFALICLISLQMWLVLPPLQSLHWTPSSQAAFSPVFARGGRQDISGIAQRLEHVEQVLLSLSASASRDLRGHEERLQHLEGEGHSERDRTAPNVQQVQDNAILKRIAGLEEAARTFFRGASKPAPCPSGMGNFTSADAMREAGWNLSVGEMAFKGGTFVGWGNNRESGSISLKVNVSGDLQLHFANIHQAFEADNEVHLLVNDELILTLARDKEKHICLHLHVGDEVKLFETYGQIQMRGAQMSCAQYNPVPLLSMLHDADDADCDLGQEVSAPDRICGSIKLAKVDRILNESRAVVKLHDKPKAVRKLSDLLRKVVAEEEPPPVSRTSQYEIFAARDLKLLSTRSRCSSFTFRRKKVAIIVVADLAYRDIYAKQIQTQRCYAAWRGYEYILLDGAAFPTCEKYRASFFFQKHCIVSEYLAEKPSDFVAAVIDADVVAVVLERGLEDWANVDADIHFYERVWCFEIAAGNYLVKATTWARNFLMRWAEFMFLQPGGFTSADNGAIHLHIIQTLELEGVDQCRAMYAGIEDLNTTSLDGYFKFVNCTKHVMGPPRLWRTSDGGSLAFWGKLHFFVADGVYLGQLSSDFFGPVFQHGVKEATTVSNTYYANLGRCEVNMENHRSREAYSEWIVKQAKFLTGHLAQWPYQVQFPGPSECDSTDKFNPCLSPCVSTLSCPLLGNKEEPKPHRTCVRCQMQR